MRGYMSGYLLRLRDHVRGRLLIGLVIFAPFALTIYVLAWFIGVGKQLMTGPLRKLILSTEGRWPQTIDSMLFNSQTGHLQNWIEYPIFAISILLALFLLYWVGLISATFIGRRYIAAGERLMLRIPGMEFVYKTIKQVFEIISRPRSQAFKEVVMVDYPRRGIRGLAFYSGLTKISNSEEVMVNVFIPTTPNPTSGFLLLMKPEEVYSTNLTVTEATRFIISGGVVALDDLQVRPFEIKAHINEHMMKRKADELSSRVESGAVIIDEEQSSVRSEN